jgi:hypothetical protein
MWQFFLEFFYIVKQQFFVLSDFEFRSQNSVGPILGPHLCVLLIEVVVCAIDPIKTIKMVKWK